VGEPAVSVDVVSLTTMQISRDYVAIKILPQMQSETERENLH